MAVGSANQTTRQLAVFTPLGTNALLLRDVVGHEQLSGLFEFRLTMLSDGCEVDPSGIVGRNITFTVDDPDGAHAGAYMAIARAVSEAIETGAGEPRKAPLFVVED